MGADRFGHQRPAFGSVGIVKMYVLDRKGLAVMDPDDLVDYDGEKVPVKDLTNEQIESVIVRLDDEEAINSAHARHLATTANELRSELRERGHSVEYSPDVAARQADLEAFSAIRPVVR